MPAGRIGNGNRLQRIENQAAAFAAVDFFIGFRAQLLQNVRQDAHAAPPALSVAGFGQGRAVVALGDARVKFSQIFRHRRDDFFVLGVRGFELLPFFRALRFNLFSFRGHGLLRFFQTGLGHFQPAIEFLRGHHDFELAVLGFGHFGFGADDFVLQRLVSFIGFHRAALVAVLARAIFPLLDFKFKFFSFGQGLGLGFFRRGDFAARFLQFRIGFPEAFRVALQLRAQGGDLMVHALELDKVRNRRMHGWVILSQGYHSGAAALAGSREADRMQGPGLQDCRNRPFQGGVEMPHVQITWVEGRTAEQKRKIAERVTVALIEDGKAKRENIHVSFHDVPATDYAEAGVLVVDQKRTP